MPARRPNEPGECLSARRQNIRPRARCHRAGDTDAGDLVDAFKSKNAVLQNSLAYFIHTSRSLGAGLRNEPDAVVMQVRTSAKRDARIRKATAGAMPARSFLRRWTA